MDDPYYVFVRFYVILLCCALLQCARFCHVMLYHGYVNSCCHCNYMQLSSLIAPVFNAQSKNWSRTKTKPQSGQHPKRQHIEMEWKPTMNKPNVKGKSTAQTLMKKGLNIIKKKTKWELPISSEVKNWV